MMSSVNVNVEGLSPLLIGLQSGITTTFGGLPPFFGLINLLQQKFGTSTLQSWGKVLASAGKFLEILACPICYLTDNGSQIISSIQNFFSFIPDMWQDLVRGINNFFLTAKEAISYPIKLLQYYFNNAIYFFANAYVKAIDGFFFGIFTYDILHMKFKGIWKQSFKLALLDVLFANLLPIAIDFSKAKPLLKPQFEIPLFNNIEVTL